MCLTDPAFIISGLRTVLPDGGRVTDGMPLPFQYYIPLEKESEVALPPAALSAYEPLRSFPEWRGRAPLRQLGLERVDGMPAQLEKPLQRLFRKHQRGSVDQWMAKEVLARPHLRIQP